MGTQGGLHGTLKKTAIFKRCLGKQAHRGVRIEALQGMEKSQEQAAVVEPKETFLRGNSGPRAQCCQGGLI